jgi:phosphatidylserine decarboxylase
MSERQPQNLAETILSGIPPIHLDGHKFIAITAIIAVLGFFVWGPLGWIFTALTLYVAYFFRDPERATPIGNHLVVSPADGRVTAIRYGTVPKELGLADSMPYTCVSIFLSVFDVHINRAPVDGRISRRAYIEGLFLNAALDKASEDNEREAMVFETASGTEIGVVRIAGLIARRIVTFTREGQAIEAGARTGLIRFGSRVDVFIPSGKALLVSVGQTVIGGETVLADLSQEETETRRVRVA